MALKTYRPTSPGLRHLVQVDRSHLFKGSPVKILTEGKRKTGGRNSDGRITTRHIGGGHKQSYRLIDGSTTSSRLSSGSSTIRTAPRSSR
jgi:large subunit ribosomal protein L2